MSNRGKVMRFRFVPPLSAAALTALLLTVSASIAPHVINEGFYGAFWLGAVSIVTLVGAIAAAITTVIFSSLFIADWIEE